MNPKFGIASLLTMFAFWLNLPGVTMNMADHVVADFHTQSNYSSVPVQHMSLNLRLDMNEKNFSGYVDLRIANAGSFADLVLDTKGLVIEATATSRDGNEISFSSVPFTLGDNIAVLGQALRIPIENDTQVVRVFYRTTAQSEGLDWIAPELTSDKFPMVVTQFQSINARTFVPCQDTPANKITYNAQIALVSDVTDPRMQVLMATDQRKKNDNGTYSFAITNRIPTYLIALAAGVFEEREISPRVKVIAEPSFVDSAAAEFADAEKMVAASEEILSPYAWRRFDIFMMPPSFSYGGMENPTMTFIGRTVVAGDKSLVDVIAHELAHSWSGNLVTNLTWDHFWINEGTTMYIERLIVEKLYGKKLRDLDIVLGQQILLDNIKGIIERDKMPEMTRLCLKMKPDFHPDDAVSHVPYEKGFNFWLALEQAYGAPAVLSFLKDYFEQFAFASCDTYRLHQLIEASPYFDGAKKVDLNAWLYGEGIPESGLPKVDSVAINEAESFIRRKGAAACSAAIEVNAHEFDSKQWCYILRKLEKPSAEYVLKLQNEHDLLNKNDEVRYNFFVTAINAGLFHEYEEHIDTYLSRVGRLKYVEPIYVALQNRGLTVEARRLFEKFRAQNNLITNGKIQRSLNL